jgi:hypothetical protein
MTLLHGMMSRNWHRRKRAAVSISRQRMPEATFAHLVDEVLQVLVGQMLPGANDLVEIRVHQLVHQVNVAEVRDLAVRWPHDVSQPDDVLVLQVPQQLDLHDAVTAHHPPLGLHRAM